MVFLSLYYCLLGIIAGIWAFLFTGPLSQDGEIFGAVKAWIYRTQPEWAYKVLIGCAKCNAFWWAVLVGLKQGGQQAEIIVLAVFTAYILQEKWMR